MNTQNEKASQPPSGGAGSPMEMGMTMAKKMMAQMGQGGSPFEMVQKMMAQMGQADGKPPMEKMMGMCMGMCGEMLSAIRATNALAVAATPELQKAFTDWLKVTEGETKKLIADGTTDTAALAGALKLTEESTRYILMRLADKGEINLAAKAKSP